MALPPLLSQQEADIIQVGVIVKDLEKTTALLSQFGLGPFTRFTATHPSAIVRGEQHAYSVNIATAQQGGVQLELIEYESGTTVQKEFLDKRGTGLHHLLFQVVDFEKTLTALPSYGLTVIQKDYFVGGGGLAYVTCDQLGDIVFEIVQYPQGEDISAGLSYR